MIAAGRFYLFYKRILDLAVAFVFIVLLFWVLAIIWLVVRLDSRGPALFRQMRVGRDGREFECYKFRTMFVSTPQAGTHEISKASVTRAGRFLRSTKLDELPQLFNVLSGQMSLVGPRPCLPSQVELVEQRRMRGVLALRPGITGLAQIHGIDMSTPVELAEWDERYMKNRSLAKDLHILVRTAIGRGSGDRLRI